MKILVTGGCGFIGSNFIRYMFREDPGAVITNLDKLTYAGNPKNLLDVEGKRGYTFVRGDICDRKLVDELLASGFDAVINFAAESHVDRSITGPAEFIQTDVFGTFTLLESCRQRGVTRYLQISTDEVYGSIEDGSFTEESPIAPNSPYSASKAGGRSAGARVPQDLRLPGAHHQVQQQLRSLPVPREAHPALYHQRHGGYQAAAVRRRNERARLALRGRQLRRHRPRSARRRPGGGLQHRRGGRRGRTWR